MLFQAPHIKVSHKVDQINNHQLIRLTMIDGTKKKKKNAVDQVNENENSFEINLRYDTILRGHDEWVRGQRSLPGHVYNRASNF